MKKVLKFNQISSKDVPLVGGKNASLGEMYCNLSKKGVRVPDGFVLTSHAYRSYLEENGIEKELQKVFKKFKPNSLEILRETGRKARSLILESEIPSDLEKEVLKHYKSLGSPEVAVRSSATAEDLPSASFAGQHETFLNVKGKKALLDAVKKCMASLFTDRAISYREEKGFSHLEIALSVGVQKMVRSDLASAGVIFTIDTETGFPGAVLVNSIWGVGEMIVKGKITSDEFYVFKPTLEKGYKPIIVKNLGRKTKKYVYGKKGGLKEVSVSPSFQLKFSLSDEEVLKLAGWARTIEKHYGRPQDIEWAKDGKTGKLFIVQSRPETVHAVQKGKFYEEYEVKSKKAPLLTGIAVGNRIGRGRARVIKDVSEISKFKKGEILVTSMTDPDWVPVMRMASAVVTDEGSKTCHAAIVSREMQLPCIVGTVKGTKVMKTGKNFTVDCTQGLRGRIYSGKVPFETKRYDLEKIPEIGTKIMVNIGAPDSAFRNSFLPVQGVGLAREEFIIAEKIKVHPLALYHFEKLKNADLKKRIEKITVEHKDKKEFFVKELAEGIAQIAAAFYPKEVIVRFSDFKTNEYRNLVGGELFEKEESNPMLGFRGASRYLDEGYQPAFLLECLAFKRVREVFGLKNVSGMVPFCRTLKEGGEVKKLIKSRLPGMKLYVMCEIPSNVLLADDFLEIFDGMSIGSNDLTQLVLGLDRDNAKMSKVSDERNEAVKIMVSRAIQACRRKKKYCGICGQAPSDYPEFARFLAKEKIESISLNPDTVIKTIMDLSKKK